MKRVILLSVALLLGGLGCTGKKAEKKAEKGAAKSAEQVQVKPPAMLQQGGASEKSGDVEYAPAAKPYLARQWAAFKKSEAVKYAPPGFQLEIFGEDEKGFIARGIVKGKTQEDIINFYISKLGKPTKKVQSPVMGNAVTLVWEGEKFSVMIQQKEGGVIVHYSKGKKGGAK